MIDEPGNEAMRQIDLAQEELRDNGFQGAVIAVGSARALAALQVARELRALVVLAEQFLDAYERADVR